MSTFSGLVMAAGYGSRLKPISDHLPKASLPFLGPPILYYSLSEFRQAGLKHVSVNTHHLKNSLMQWMNNPFCTISWIVEDQLLGSSGTLHHFKNQHVCVINADVAFDCDLQEAFEKHLDRNAAISILCTKRTDQSAYIQIADNQDVVSFQSDQPGLYGAGIFFYSPKAVELVPPKYFTFKELVVAVQKNQGKIFADPCVQHWYDLGQSPRGFFSSQKTIYEKDPAFLEKLLRQYLDPLSVYNEGGLFSYAPQGGKILSHEGLVIAQNLKSNLDFVRDAVVIPTLITLKQDLWNKFVWLTSISFQ